ncbi:MAG TPA: hypothetical protein VND65_03910 [Candidatus Binatia bacterium]|nr:hypothetical protein [Candidatus Binatia bacterium]
MTPQGVPAQVERAGIQLHTVNGTRIVRVGPRTPLNPANTGYHGQVVVAADPESAANLIVCGFRADQRRGAAYEGYVYQSTDAGDTWHEALVDSNSQWVSEESCAFGPAHVAYFVTGVTDTSHGLPQMGNMHLYRSADGGGDWQNIAIEPFFDYTAVAVDATGGQNRGTVYIFANTAGDDTNEQEIAKTPFLAARRELPSTSLSVTAGRFNLGDTGVRFPSKFPSDAIVLDDGTALAAFMGDREVADPATGNSAHRFSVLVGRSDDGGRSLRKVSVEEADVPGIPGGLAEDVGRGITYLCWTPRYGSSKKSKLMLGLSRDSGQTWSVKSVRPPDGAAWDMRPASASLAVNREGILGFLWYGETGERAYFGISADQGDSLAAVIPLTPPNVETEIPFVDERRLFITPPSWNARSSQLDPLKILALGPGVSGVPLGNALAADRDGNFHAVWNEVANGPTSLWTAKISVEEPGLQPSVSLTGLGDVSDLLVSHIANVRFDRIQKNVIFDLTVTNKSSYGIIGPVLARIDFGSRHGTAENADAMQDDQGLWKLIGEGEVLGPEHSTAPRSIILGLEGKVGDELDFPFRIYARVPRALKRHCQPPASDR